jgi:Fe-S-cluster containining protein
MNEEVVSTPCFLCGICCTRYQVRLSLIEARRISDRLALLWDEFLSKYIDQYWPEAMTFFLRCDNGKCVFLGDVEDGNMRRCLIHPVKPSACGEWNPSFYRSECQAGLAKHWGLTVSSSGKLKGPEQKLRDFNSFMESCKRIVQ